jgi:hypothetical protein
MRFRGDRNNTTMVSVLAVLALVLVGILAYYFVFAPK